MRALLVLAAAAAMGPTIFAAPCPFSTWTTYRGAAILRLPQGTAYAFSSSSVKVDADGAPNAYHPDDIGLPCAQPAGFKGLDCPANAGYPNSKWWPDAVVADPEQPDRAYVQPAGREFAGFFVSQTSLKDLSKSQIDPARYVDSRRIPYLVFPRVFHNMKGTGRLGDIGYAANTVTGRTSPFVVAEIGPSTAGLGEISIALASALGGEAPNPRTGAGAPKGVIVYAVFPMSSRSFVWPQTSEQIATQAKQLLDQVGGIEALVACKDALSGR